MQNLLDDLKEALEKDENLLVEGQLNKALIEQKALALDKDFLKLLLDSDSLKKHFFEDIDGTLVFDKVKFQQFIHNKSFLPDSYTSFKNKIGLTSNGNYVSKNNDVVLAWPHKDCVLEGGQDKEDAKRDEIFWNETLAPDDIDRLLAPKVITNWKKYDKDGKHEVEAPSLNDNYLIKGNNLLALHSLADVYRGKVKLIYIDPPYNTGNDDFGYNDRFNHSTWLTFMKNRLEIAKELLSSDGSIYIQLDYNEIHYCKVLMDDIFGKENFRREIIWYLGTSSGFKTAANNWVRDHDSILYYSKSDNPKFNKLYRDYDDEYKSRFKKKDAEGRKYRDDRSNGERQYLDELKGIRISDVWGDIMSFQQASTSSEYLKFSGQKPEQLLSRIIKASTDKGDLVLDFFLGTGTTAATALKLQRKFIGVEQLNYRKKHDSLHRLKKVIEGEQGGISKEVEWEGGGSFLYAELKKANQQWVDEIQEAENEKALKAIWEKMKEKALISYKVNPGDIDGNAEEFSELSLNDQKRFLIEVLDKNLLYVNYSEIDDADFAVSEEDKELNHAFYGLKK
jgi:adenine-specific DNA-methyltransferase